MGTLRAKKATDQTLRSHAQVTRHAKAVTESLTNRDKRAETEPFLPIVFDEEDSLVTSIENIVASKNRSS